MDKDAEKQELLDLQGFTQAWLDHPITKSLVEDNEQQQKALLAIFCNEGLVDQNTPFVLIEIRGHLRGLRRFRVLVDEQLEDVKEKLKDYE